MKSYMKISHKARERDDSLILHWVPLNMKNLLEKNFNKKTAHLV